MKINYQSCPNCESNFNKDFSFCPHCGQKNNDELTIGLLFYNTISNYFSFDARFFKSFIPLMVKPGFLAKAFIRGKRLLYLHPAQMYLFVTVVFFFVFSFFVRDGRVALDKSMANVLAERTNSRTKIDSVKVKDSLVIGKLSYPLILNNKALNIEDNDIKKIDSLSKLKVPIDDDGVDFLNESKIDSLIASGSSDQTIYKYLGMPDDVGYFTKRFYKQGLKFYKTMGLGQIYQTFIDSIPVAMFFLLPMFAFLLKLFFFNKGKYVYHLVFSFYYFSFLFLVFSILFGINRFIEIPSGLNIIVALSTFFYLVIAILKFYEQSWVLSLVKAGTVSLLFLLLVLPMSLILLALISFLFY